MISLVERGIPHRHAASSAGVLHRVFEATARNHPGAVAVISGGDAVTYGELDGRANRLARYLRRRGVGRTAAVAISLPRSIDAYAAILGVLKAGAAYVPIDPAWPAERIDWMLADCRATAILTSSVLEKDRCELAHESSQPLPPADADAEPSDLCYVIYTSGSTGRPKGVMVEHRNVSHLVEAESEIFAVRPSDRVFQGASLCFDLSIEEMWLAFRAGATLVAGTPEMAQSGPDLSRHLAAAGVSVLSCVPTLLSMFDGDVPSLRLLILGGERCAPELVERWARPGRRIVNTYGPTETTVIATSAELSPEGPVTIGRAIPGCDVYILDDNLRPVAPGETGEICIGGAGVARGYMGLREETGARFVNIAGAARIFRSGDLGRMDRRGRIEFVGRADAQIKLRGLRIEPGEIESAIMRCGGVRAAACVVRENARGEEQLIACFVPADSPAEEKQLLLQLRRWLPEWMVPSHLEAVTDLPRLPSGKLDRAALRSIPLPRRPQPVQTSTATERRLLDLWNALFQPHPVSLDDDFFLDLGGHSLLAAHMVSEARGDPAFASVTMRDVYYHPTVAALAQAIDSRQPSMENARAASPPLAGPEVRRRRHFLAGMLQTLSLYFIFAFRGVQWIAPYLIYFLLAAKRPVVEAALWALASAILLLPLLTLTAVCAKWMLLGKVKPGRYPLWGAFHLRWWFIETVVRSLPLKRFGGTPLLPFVYRLFGARIGQNVQIATDRLSAFDVISIGHGASIDDDASLTACAVENGHLVIGPISVGRNCYVGTGCVLSPGSIMEDEARLEDLSLLPAGAAIPAAETWAGSPPRRVFRDTLDSNPPPARTPSARIALIAAYAALACCFPIVELAAFLPGVLLLMHSWLFAPLAGACFILCATGMTVLAKWLLIGRARAGTYPVDGSLYIRNWIVEQLLALSVDVAGPLHATVFLKPWYRALGAKVGRFTEVSTAAITTPDLLEIGEDCTVADEVSLGAARVERGWLTLAPTKLGRRVFVGNNAVIPAGAALADETLIGVMTVAPPDSGRAASWLGSPALLLPRRRRGDFPEERTFRPGRKRQCARGCFELLRVTLPATGFILVAVALLETAANLWSHWGPVPALLALPASLAVYCAAVSLAVAAVKWIVVGRYRPFQQPFWNAFVWRLEFVNALFEFLAAPICLDALRGTPLLPWYLRLLGARIGRQVWIDSTGFLEFDLVEIGDRAMLNQDCILQTHLFEDRVLKASALRVGADCEIGARSVVLCDSRMSAGARLGPLSLLMQGEVLPSNPRPSGKVWIGSPLAHAKESPADMAGESVSSPLSPWTRHRNRRVVEAFPDSGARASVVSRSAGWLRARRPLP